MRTKIVAAILCVLAALGLVNVGKTLTNRFFHHEVNQHEHRYSHVEARTEVNRHSTTYVSTGDEVIVDKRFDVDEGGLLDLSIGHADVSIETSGSDVATVRVTLHARDLEIAREYFESLNFDARKDGDRIIVKTEPSKRNWNWRSTGGAEINVEVVIPRRFSADVSVAHGDLDLGDLVGDVNLRVAHGDATVGSIDGDNVEVNMAHGDVELEAVKARTVRFKTAHGDFMTGPLSADDLNVKSAHGDLQLDVRSSGSIEISNSHGEINLALAEAVGGTIRNSHGDIEIDAPEDLAANVEFRGDKVKMSGNYSFGGSQSKSSMEGSLNGGGPTLKAHTSFGTIAVN